MFQLKNAEAFDAKWYDISHISQKLWYNKYLYISHHSGWNIFIMFRIDGLVCTELQRESQYKVKDLRRKNY